MDVQKYLDRIGYQGPVEVSLACLASLQLFHQMGVPFENLDNFTDRKKVLKHEALYEQIVTNNRGGWCHELNGCFSWLLEQLGFTVSVISAQYYNPELGEFCKVFDHMVLIVELAAQKYLVDVGFGNISQPSEPIRLSENSVHNITGGIYKMERRDGWWCLLQRDRDVVGHHKPGENRALVAESWTVMYKFDEVARKIEEFQERCDEYQTYLETMILSFIPIAIIKSENGGLVKTLIGDRFTTVRLQDNADIRVNRLNLETEDYNKILRETFSISLPQEQQLDIEKIMRPLKTEHY